jgi:hypothetical protein
MAICTDCITANDLKTTQSPNCKGFTVTVTFETGTVETSKLEVIDNPSSVLGYDYTFLAEGQEYSVIYTGSVWVILNKLGEKLSTSSSLGVNNNLCPPTDGWSAVSGEFVSIFVNQKLPPNPSVKCVASNSTFNSDATGWTVVNGAWSAAFGGTVKYDTTLLCSIAQNALTVGETYAISISYYAPVWRESCSPEKYNESFIRISAGTNSYREPLKNTITKVGQVITLSVELTCETNTTLKVELQDPYQCFATVSTAIGIYLDDICAVQISNNVDPIGPSPLSSVTYEDHAEVPARVNEVDYNTKLLQFQECLAKKGTTFYNKVIGAVKCDYRELTKLKLIIGLLSQKSEDRALDCIYDRVEFPTTLYQGIPCNITVLSIVSGSKTATITGDYSKFENFVFTITSPAGYSSRIIDASYNSQTNNTTVLLANSFTANISTATVCFSQDKGSTNTYLETFIDFANRFCSDCIVTGPAPTPTTPITPSLEITESTLISETGLQLTTEFNQQITI